MIHVFKTIDNYDRRLGWDNFFLRRFICYDVNSDFAEVYAVSKAGSEIFGKRK